MRTSSYRRWYCIHYALLWFVVLGAALFTACTAGPLIAPPSLTPVATVTDHTGPTITALTASSKVFAKSDCTPTAITVTATISDPAGVTSVTLWYHVGDNQPFTPVMAKLMADDHYVVSVKGADVPGADYGVWEFYVTADDGLGNQSQSPTNTRVQLLPCVG